MGDEPRQITVSRDALRADLLDLELRLKDHLDTKLELKASAEHLYALEHKVALIEQGKMPHGLELSVRDVTNTVIRDRAKNAWFFRGNKLAVAVGAAAFGGLFVAIANILVH